MEMRLGSWRGKEAESKNQDVRSSKIIRPPTPLPESYSTGVSPNEEYACKLLGKGNTDHIPLKTGLDCFFSTGWN